MNARTGWTLSTWALLLATTLAYAATPIDLRSISPLSGDAVAGKDKAAVCFGCHGASGVAVIPTFPNLAGQPAEYLYWRLVAFKRAGLADSPMAPLVAGLDDAAMRDLAAYFSSQPAPAVAPSRSADAALEPGRRLFREGDPARGTPPCQGCHGTDAGGHPDATRGAHWRVYPALRGQHAVYVEQRLRQMAADPTPATTSGHVMGPVARTLDPGSMASIAAWLEAGAP